MKKHTKKIIILIIISALISLYYIFGINKILTFEMFQNNKEMFLDYVSVHYVIAVIVFIIVYIIATALSLPIATPLTLLGGYLFGTFIGGFYVVVGATIGAYLIYILAKTVLREWCVKKIGNVSKTKNLINELENHGFNHLLFLRIVPLFPFFLVNIVPALVKFKDRDYILATFIGIIPGTLVYSNVGKELESIDSLSGLVSRSTILAFLLLGILSLFPIIIRKLKHT